MAPSQRSFPNSSPDSLNASTTPSVKKIKASPGLSSRDALPGDISDYHHKFLAILRIGIECVVIIAGYGILRTRCESDVRARDFRRLRRYQPGLNLPRDFQVALHRDLVSQFQRKQQDEEQNGDHFEVLLGIDGRQRQHDESEEQKDAPGG